MHFHSHSFIDFYFKCTVTQEYSLWDYCSEKIKRFIFVMVKTKQMILWPNVDLSECICELKKSVHCASGWIILLATIRLSWLMVLIRAPVLIWLPSRLISIGYWGRASSALRSPFALSFQTHVFWYFLLSSRVCKVRLLCPLGETAPW